MAKEEHWKSLLNLIAEYRNKKQANWSKVAEYLNKAGLLSPGKRKWNENSIRKFYAKHREAKTAEVAQPPAAKKSVPRRRRAGKRKSKGSVKAKWRDATLAAVFSLRNAGATPTQIAEALNQRKHTRFNGTPWTNVTVGVFSNYYRKRMDKMKAASDRSVDSAKKLIQKSVSNKKRAQQAAQQHQLDFGAVELKTKTHTDGSVELWYRGGKEEFKKLMRLWLS